MSPKSPFQKPEKPNWIKIAAIVAFLAFGGAAIGYMIANAPRQKALVCDNTSVPGSLNAFGRCKTE
jgi:hypothetical protein